MRRVNYLISWDERRFGVALPTTVAPALRLPMTVLACALALVGILWSVQHARLRGAQREGAAYASRLSEIAPALGRARRIQAETSALRARAERAQALRASGALQANAIAALGDRLPPDVWLTSLRAEAAAVALQGRGARLESIAAALNRLAGLRDYRAVRLVSAREDPGFGAITYAISLEKVP